MNTLEWPPQVGAWYLRWDRNQVFQVTGYDEKTGRARTVSYDGVSGEINEATWGSLSLGLADPPEDWTAPLETVDVLRLSTAQNDPVSEDVSEPSAPSD
jgi:hypothetical protein